MPKITDNGYVHITHTKNGQFKMSNMGGNHEPLQPSESLTTMQSVIGNILATMRLYGGSKVLVKDSSDNNKAEYYYYLNSDNTTSPVGEV